VGTALSTSVSSNATAFGFSITITVGFGVVQTLEGSPTLFELMLFGIAAATAVGLLEAAVTRGFRRRVGAAPPEVSMMGTALNFASVAAGVGAAIGIGEVIDGTAVWPIASFTTAAVYVLVEAVEVLLAEAIQSARGDAEAAKEQK
jgi:hypothetical protein